MAVREVDLNLEEYWQTLSTIDFSFYCEYTHHGAYFPYKVHQYLCDVLEKVERGEITRLIITMPPQHGKSMTVTETFPSWFIGKNPNKRVIIASYGDRFASKFGRKNRSKIREFGDEIFDIELNPENKSVQDWSIQNTDGSGLRGGMIAASIGGSITGEGADLMVIDDPYKNRKDADSSHYRQFVWNEWEDTLQTRLSADAAVILIQTRWHEDDLAGRLIKEDGIVEENGKWNLLKIPCEAKDDDTLGRSEGDALLPEMGKDKAWIQEVKLSVGSRAWHALYQQDPTPDGGSIVDKNWFLRFDYNTKHTLYDQMINSWDCSFKDTDDTSFVVGQCWIKKGPDAYLYDQVRKRMNFPATVRAILSMKKKWEDTSGILVEEKANGPAIISVLEDRVPGLLPIIPKESKESRLHAVSPFIESGNVWVPRDCDFDWMVDFIDEVSKFPNADNDDQVDAMTQALKYFFGDASASIVDLYT